MCQFLQAKKHDKVGVTPQKAPETDTPIFKETNSFEQTRYLLKVQSWATRDSEDRFAGWGCGACRNDEKYLHGLDESTKKRHIARYEQLDAELPDHPDNLYEEEESTAPLDYNRGLTKIRSIASPCALIRKERVL